MNVLEMASPAQPGLAEGSVSESVHFPPTNSVLEHSGVYHRDGRLAMAPPMSSASGASLARPTAIHDNGRANYLRGGYDRSEYEYALRRQNCDRGRLGLHSGTLIEQMFLQENQKALRMASIVQSQASASLSGCQSCLLGEKRPRFLDPEDDQRCHPRNVSDQPSRSLNLVAEVNAVEYPEGCFQQPRPRQLIGKRSQSVIPFPEEEHGPSLCQWMRAIHPACHSRVSHLQGSHHVQDHHVHIVGGAESSVPTLGLNDDDRKFRHRRPTQRQSYSQNGPEEDGGPRPSRSRVVLASSREQDRVLLPDISTGSLYKTSVGGPHRAVRDHVRLPQFTHSYSQSLCAVSETDPTYQDYALQQSGIHRLVARGPVSLTNWYIMKVQVPEVGRVLTTKIAVGGWLVQNREHVKTSPILNRLDIHKVVTEDGVEVLLDGVIDKETSTANGFSPGIVQCLSAGFPYMWKQLLRVRPVVEVRSLAVSECLEGLHLKDSNSFLEDESQGVDDPKILKITAEDDRSRSRDREGTSPAPAVNEDSVATSGNIPSDAVEAEVAVTAGAEASVGLQLQSTDIVRAQTLRTVETEAIFPARAERSGAADECFPQDVLMQQPCDINPTSIGPLPATEAALEHMAVATLTKEAESDLYVETTSETTRWSCKSKNILLQPVRSSKRLQQRQSRSSDITRNLVDSVAHSIEKVARVSIARDKSLEEELVKSVPDVERSTIGREEWTGSLELTKTDNIIEGISKDLQQDQGWPQFISERSTVFRADPVGNSAAPQPMAVEVLGQIEDQCENLSVSSDGVECLTSKGEEAVEDALAGVEMEAAVPTNLKYEKVDDSIPLSLNLELGSEEIEESARTTTPDLLHGEVQCRVDPLSKPTSLRVSAQRVFSEINARVTRSLKRRTKVAPTAEADVPPVKRSLKRIRSLPNVETPCISDSYLKDGADLEAISMPDFLQEEVDVHLVKLELSDGSCAKAINCSNCNQPCSPSYVRNYNRNVLGSKLTPKKALSKEERADHAPSSPSQDTVEVYELLKDDRIENYSMKRPSGRFKRIKPATRFAETATPRRLIVGDLKTGSTKGRGVGQALVSHSGERFSKGEGFNKVVDCIEDKCSREVKGRSEGHDFNEGTSEGPKLVSSHMKNRRTSIIPPPLPPPRVQDKSRVPEAFGLKKSRSGRLLVPPLAYWRSQSIEYDKDGGIIAILDGFQAKPADTGCFNFTPPQEKHAKRIQEKLCKAATVVVKRK